MRHLNSSAKEIFPFPHPQEHSPWFYEQSLYEKGFLAVGGVDEAGRGPLAGPVIASCVVLPCRQHDSFSYKDSKTLTASQRESLFLKLQDSEAVIGVGRVDPQEIETLNIHQASLLAMRRAVSDCNGMLKDAPLDFLLVDGKFKVPLPLAQQPLIKGESRSYSIAAASIVAKVTRDKIMAAYHEQFPQYGFKKNQGYPTKEHRLAIKEYGITPLHRQTFKGVREFVQDDERRHVAQEQQTLW